MKRYKKLGILLAVLGVGSSVTFGVMKHQEVKEDIRNSDTIILELDPAHVQTLSRTYDSHTFSLPRDTDWE